MTRLSIDHEHSDRTWWDAGGQELWDAIADFTDTSSVILDDDVAKSWLEAASRLPGWTRAEGAAHAPHPVYATPLREGEVE